jgi:hypothetical protein
MKKTKWFLIALSPVLALILLAMPVHVSGDSVTKSYGDVTLTGGYQAGHFPEVWDLTCSDMVLSFTYDGNGLVDEFGWGAHAWSALGIRAVGYGDFNPTWDVEGAGVWLATDYDSTAGTFAPDPPGAPILDLDDKVILQKAGGHGEGDYNLPSVPPAPGNNHRVWWDRDGVDPWQNPATANTGGIYQIVITLSATSATTGTAYMNIRGLDQGFETDGNWNTIELTPAGMTFTGDMTQMQVFYGLYGYGPDDVTHTVSFNDINVTGCPPKYLLTSLSPANIWVGLKNSDDVGTKFDLLAEVLKNGEVVGSGQLNSVNGGSSGFNNASLRTIALALSGTPTMSSGDKLSIRLSVRIATLVSGHRSGTARLWFNDSQANSNFDATIGGVSQDYFLRDGFALATSPAPVTKTSKKTIDVFVDKLVGGNPFKTFGTWNITLP